tara:strand:- start:128 stop:595 length:468 start_codon:yes stop_codon:yes gene_type:complete
MSSNRLIYDDCEAKTLLDQSTGQLAYIINPIKYENCKKCRMELGIVSGQDVSTIKGNMVDLESDLLGVTRPPTQRHECSSRLFHPQQANQIKVQARSPNQEAMTIDTTPVHLPCCQMFSYKKAPTPSPFVPESCPRPGSFSKSLGNPTQTPANNQ